MLPLTVVLTLVLLAGAERASAMPVYGSCSIKPDRTVWCWGVNWTGSVSPGLPNLTAADITASVAPVPVQVPGVSGARQVVGSTWSACAVLDDGHVACWGFGPRGDGVELDAAWNTGAAPLVMVDGLDDAVAITGAWGVWCALRRGGEVACWGMNSSGQLGNGGGAEAWSPVAVHGISTAVALDTNGDTTCAVLASGHVRCWGSNSSGQLGDGTTDDSPVPVDVTDRAIEDAVDVVVGAQGFVCAIRRGGTLVCWGEDLSALPGLADLDGMTGVRDLASSYYATCVTSVDGGVRCVGSNTYGLVGDGAGVDADHFVRVPGLDDVVAVEVGLYHACATRSDGAVLCWGMWALGNGADSGFAFAPAAVPGLEGVSAVRSGRGGSCAVATGELWCWGDNESDMLGTGTNSRYLFAATPAAAFGAVLDVAPSSTAVCSLAAGGSVTCRYPSGDSDTRQVDGAVAVTRGYRHTCVRDGDGAVWCWGDNGYGQLGDGTRSPHAVPARVTGLGAATAIAAGDNFTCALIGSPGTVSCWGDNGYGQLGDGTHDDSSSPVGVDGLSGVLAVATGSGHACAALGGAGVMCWGRNDNGQLGDGTADDSATPVQVPGVPSAIAVSAGDSMGCAVTAERRLFCWGRGLVGDGGWYQGPRTARQVPGVTDAVQVAVGADHACVLHATGRVSCWGDNSSGQVGDGFAPEGHGPQVTPRRVAGFGPGAPPPADVPADRPVVSPPDAPAPAVVGARPSLAALPWILGGPAPVQPLRLVRDRLIVTGLEVRGSGPSCPAAVTVRVVIGRRVVRRLLPVTASLGRCAVLNAQVRLPRAARGRRVLRVVVAGPGVRRARPVARRSAR